MLNFSSQAYLILFTEKHFFPLTFCVNRCQSGCLLCDQGFIQRKLEKPHATLDSIWNFCSCCLRDTLIKMTASLSNLTLLIQWHSISSSYHIFKNSKIWTEDQILDCISSALVLKGFFSLAFFNYSEIQLDWIYVWDYLHW